MDRGQGGGVEDKRNVLERHRACSVSFRIGRVEEKGKEHIENNPKKQKISG